MKKIIASVFIVVAMMIGAVDASEEPVKGFLMSVGEEKTFETDSSVEDKRVGANESLDTANTVLNIGYRISDELSLALTNDVYLYKYEKIVQEQNIGLNTGALRISMYYRWD
ncbi:MAG: hypothetical protein L3J43_02655 [Sulfurovum sp.]|nr:hypothetical protein [Sulfurovum sp.]